MTDVTTKYKPIIKIWKEAVPIPVVDHLYTEFRLMRDALLSMGSSEGYRDPTVPGTFSWYSPLCFEALSLQLKPQVEKILKTNLEPTYSYGRIYTEGSELVRHTDRRSSEIAVNLSIARDIKWDLNFLWEEQTLHIDLEPGDVVIYSGDIPHWREKYTGNEHINAFMQYVYADGQYKDLKYDTRPYLATPFALAQQDIQDEVNNYV